MCDTLAALGTVSRDGRTLLAKNSDRQPNEPHIMVRMPRMQHHKGSRVKCTYIEVEQRPMTYEVLLLKPSWIWGCEMGSNEFGLNIGNEAVFTREKYAPSGLTGMDLVRLALERCRSSEEAVNEMVSLLDQYGQGGNCGYDKKFTYHNSFLIADPHTAWVLETAGKYWAAQEVQDIQTISNGLSIGKLFDRAHPELIEHAVEKGWCSSERDFDFARCYRDPVFTYFSGARTRREFSRAALEKHRGDIDVSLMKSILRSHQPEVEGRQFRRSSLKSICMHGGGWIGDHTTGSYIAVLDQDQSLYWVTGSSTPCISLFKPLWLIDNPYVPLTGNAAVSLSFWQKREQFHRMVLNQQITDFETYIAERDRLEEEWIQLASGVRAGQVEEQARIMKYAWEAETRLISRMIKENEGHPRHMQGSPYYRRYWQQQTEKFKKTCRE